MSMILLVEEFTWEISVVHIDIPVFIPTFGSIARYIITKYVNEACIQRIPFCERAIRIWHV